jgi:hypothetical protein
LAQLAGVKDERTYYSEEVGPKGRESLKIRGRHKLYVPAALSVSAAVMGYAIMGWIGVLLPLLFFVGNAWIQSIANPLISERRALYKSTAIPAVGAYTLLLVNGTFAATLVAWMLFKPAVDQQHSENVAIVMKASEERRVLMIAEGALEKERASLLEKQQVNTSGIDRAMNAYVLAQETAAKANAAYQNELTKGNGVRRAGNGDMAKALRDALQIANAAEASAKLALVEARKQASVTISVPEDLSAAYQDAKGKYEAREKSLLEAGPGLLKTFWFLIGMMHTEPFLIAFLFIWAAVEASGVITHAFAGDSVYERAKLNAQERMMEERREARRIQAQRVKDRAEHEAEMKTARSEAKNVISLAKDRARR